MSPTPSSTNAPSQSFVLIPVHQLQQLITEAVSKALIDQETKHKGEQRLSTAQAALFLGRSTAYLQELHKQGLPYEKGRPNFYKLSDLEQWRENRRLQLI